MDAPFHPHPQLSNVNSPLQGFPLYLIMIPGYEILKKTKQVKTEKGGLQAYRRVAILVVLAFFRGRGQVVQRMKIALP